MLDDWMLKHLGTKFRSQAVFATGDKSFAENYGQLYQIFPIGDFKFAYSEEYADLYLDGVESVIPRIKKKVVLSTGKEVMGSELDMSKVNKELINELMMDAEFVVNKDFKTGIKFGHELMIHCKQYYIILANSKILKEF